MINNQLLTLHRRPGCRRRQGAADWHNRLKLAASTRLGIPITLSTDPRKPLHREQLVPRRRQTFSQWPETLGLAAIGSSELVERFADIARQEYPRWVFAWPCIRKFTSLQSHAGLGSAAVSARMQNLTSTLVQAYIRGFQGEQPGRNHDDDEALSRRRAANGR